MRTIIDEETGFSNIVQEPPSHDLSKLHQCDSPEVGDAISIEQPSKGHCLPLTFLEDIVLAIENAEQLVLSPSEP